MVEILSVVVRLGCIIGKWGIVADVDFFFTPDGMFSSVASVMFIVDRVNRVFFITLGVVISRSFVNLDELSGGIKGLFFGV